MALSKNQNLSVSVTSQGKKGEGIAFHNNFPIYIPNSIPGDDVQIKIIRIEKRRAFARVQNITNCSKDRVTPPCSIASQCGGCQLQHQNISSQLMFKDNLIKSRLSRFINIVELPLQPIIPSRQLFEFRNKMQFAIQRVNNDVHIGLYAPRSHRVINAPICPIMTSQMNDVLNKVRNWIQETSSSVYNEQTKTGNLRFLTIRHAVNNNELMVVLTGTSELKSIQSFCKTMCSIKEIKSIYYSIQCDPTDDHVMGAQLTHTWGNPTIQDHILNLTCQISPKSFIQGNASSIDLLYTTFVKLLGWDQKSRLIDLYCGTGILTMIFGRLANKKDIVVGVDDHAQAITDAHANAKGNQLDIEFICQKAEEYLLTESLNDATVVLDPPRQGVHPGVIEALIRSTPKKIGFISCNVDTLGRDCRPLIKHGYKILDIQPVDMFCHTPHVELCLVLVFDPL